MSHNLWNTPTYSSWRSMKKRCLNINHDQYPRYGAKGIMVCDEWLQFKNFLKDMGERPSKNHTLDRIDNSKGYFKSNCRWVTVKEQNRNRTSNKLTLKKADQIRRLYATGSSAKELALQFEVSDSTIFKVVSGLRWV